MVSRLGMVYVRHSFLLAELLAPCVALHATVVVLHGYIYAFSKRKWSHVHHPCWKLYNNYKLAIM